MPKQSLKLMSWNVNAYTWWSNFRGARARNIGWRIDYFFVSPKLKQHLVSASIHPDVTGSDHCPVELVFTI